MKQVLWSLLMIIVIAAMFILGGSLAHAQEVVGREPNIFGLYGGANVVWFDNDARPSDFEIGANARAALSPHIALVGSTYFGIDNSYLRASLGTRITATDAYNQNFSVGFGIQRHFSSEPALRPEEWAPDVTVGWKPWPISAPKLSLGVQGQYGLSSTTAAILAGVRYKLIPAY